MPKLNMDLERRKLRAMFILLGTVLVGMALYMAMASKSGSVQETAAAGVIAIVILALMFPILRSGYVNVKRGMPMKDERTRRIETKSAAIAFYLNLYVLLAIGFFGNDLEVHTATGIAILVSALVFLFANLILSRSAKV